MNLVIDGNSMAYKNWVANKLMCNTQGEGTGVLFGLYRTIIPVVEKLKNIDRIFICWDKGKKFRKDLFKENEREFLKFDRFCGKKETYTSKVQKGYKGTRTEDPDIQDFYKQLDNTKLFFNMLGIQNIEIEEVEGDDIVNKVSLLMQPSVILSGDTDFLQCVKGNVQFYWHNNSERFKDQIMLFTEKNFEYKFNEKEGFPLLRKSYVHYKAIIGDKSDNIFGISGVGEKTMQKALAEYNYNFDEFYNSDHPVALKVKEQAPVYFFCLKAVTLAYADKYIGKYIEENLPDLNSKLEIKVAEVRKLASRFELKQFLDNFDNFIDFFRRLR